MIEVQLEKQALITELERLCKNGIACQLIVGELEELTRPGNIIEVNHALVKFKELYFNREITFAKSQIVGISQQAPISLGAIRNKPLPLSLAANAGATTSRG